AERTGDLHVVDACVEQEPSKEFADREYFRLPFDDRYHRSRHWSALRGAVDAFDWSKQVQLLGELLCRRRIALELADAQEFARGVQVLAHGLPARICQRRDHGCVMRVRDD